VKEFYGLVLINLAAEEADKSVQGVLLDIFRALPYGVENGLAGGDAAFMAHKEFEQAKFGGREMDFPSSAEDATLGDFQGQVADAQGMKSRLEDAALEGADTGEEDGEGEWLGYIVVGSGVEAFDDVGDRVAGGEHQNRDVLLHVAEAAGDLNAIDAGEHDVEKDEVELGVVRQGERGKTVMREAYGVIVFFEPAAEHLGHAPFVFDYEDFHVNWGFPKIHPSSASGAENQASADFFGCR
jgi:hypothetical protein